MAEQPSLKHLKEFKEVLKNYQISDRARQATQDLKLVLMLGPASAGKNTIIRHLVGTGRYYFIVSDTTRPQRVNDGVMEQNGVQYWFRPEAEVLADLKSGEYIEAEIIHGQQVSGVSVRELEKAQKQGKIAITDVDPEGVRNILIAKPDTIVVLLIPPSFAEWQRRFNKRGHMDEAEKRRRLETAQRLLKNALNQPNYHYVVSEEVEQTAKIIDALVAGQPNPAQASAQSTAQQLITDLDSYLKNI